MKFTDTKHTLTVSAGEATQALSDACRKISIFATAAMKFDLLDTDEGTLTNAVVTAAAADTAEVRTVTLTETFGIGDVLRVTVDSNNVDYTVASADLATVASELAAAINANATVAAIVTATSSAGVVTLTAGADNDAFTLASSINNRDIEHHIGANERLELEVVSGSTIRVEGTGTLHVSELY